jgi:hypothetical protein
LEDIDKLQQSPEEYPFYTLKKAKNIAREALNSIKK